MIDVTAVWDTLHPDEQRKLRDYVGALMAWNARVNLVSRRTTPEQALKRHVFHALALHARPFASGTTVVDWGTGGGLPGLVLALVQPGVEFVLVDSIRKKAHAVEGMARELGADNVVVWNGRAESWDGRAHYAVSRATAPLKTLWAWSDRVLVDDEAPAQAWPPGLWALKGRGLDDVREMQGREEVRVEEHPLAPPFEDKVLVSVARQ